MTLKARVITRLPAAERGQTNIKKTRQTGGINA